MWMKINLVTWQIFYHWWFCDTAKIQNDYIRAHPGGFVSFWIIQDTNLFTFRLLDCLLSEWITSISYQSFEAEKISTSIKFVRINNWLFSLSNISKATILLFFTNRFHSNIVNNILTKEREITSKALLSFY